jgi:hypothetical protein
MPWVRLREASPIRVRRRGQRGCRVRREVFSCVSVIAIDHCPLLSKAAVTQCSEMASVFCDPKRCSAIGIVLASPDKNKVQPKSIRGSRFNLPASNKPAPKPIAPRVTAINAISGKVTLFGCKRFIGFLRS